MRKISLSILAAGMLFLASVPMAGAQYFNYSTVFAPNPVPANVAPATNYLGVTDGANIGVFAGLFGSNIVLTNFATVSDTPDTPTPDPLNQNYSVALTLRQSDSVGTPFGSPVTHTFTGNLAGSISTSASNVNNTFFPAAIQAYDFGGGVVFIVDLNTYVPPGAPGTADRGAIGAHVNGPLANVPEPGTLSMLFGSGIGGSLLFLRRRKA